MNKETQQKLIVAARQAKKNAYSPFSGYKVGAALLTDCGKIFTGCNVENSSYRLTICAEATAISKAVSEGYQKFSAIVIATDDGGSPCGACRQTIWEFAEDIEVLIVDKKNNIKKYTAKKLLPDAFKIKK